MSKRVYPVSDEQMRKDSQRNKAYVNWAKNVDKELKARYGDNYKAWPDDYGKKA